MGNAVLLELTKHASPTVSSIFQSYTTARSRIYFATRVSLWCSHWW